MGETVHDDGGMNMAKKTMQYRKQFEEHVREFAAQNTAQCSYRLHTQNLECDNSVYTYWLLYYKLQLHQTKCLQHMVGLAAVSHETMGMTKLI